MKYSVKKFMTKEMHSTTADEPLDTAYKKLKKNKIRHLPVVDESGDVIGVISERDFLRARVKDKKEVSFASDATVLSYMSWPIKTVPSTESLINASRKMIDEKISALIVTEGEDAVGIITHEDLLRVLLNILSHQEKSLKEKVQQWAYNSPLGQVANFLSNSGI